MNVLDVELRGFEKGDARRRRAVVDGVQRSLATGFVYLEHAIPEDELDLCYSRLDDFFRLPLDVKRRAVVDGSSGQRGYTGLRVETAASATEADWKEMLNWGEPAPENHPLGQRFPGRYGPPGLPEDDLPGITKQLMTFHRNVHDLQRRFLRIVAEGLGAHETFFDAMTRHGASLTRAIHYPPMQEAPEQGAVWAAEHGDVNLVTALPRATAPGLQLKTQDGWMDVEPPPGYAVLNAGMMLEHFSNGRLPTGIHRVVAAPDQHDERLSVVQFCHPTPSTILAPMKSCIGPDHPERFGVIAAANRLDEVLWEINLADSS